MFLYDGIVGGREDKSSTYSEGGTDTDAFCVSINGRIGTTIGCSGWIAMSLFGEMLKLFADPAGVWCG